METTLPFSTMREAPYNLVATSIPLVNRDVAACPVYHLTSAFNKLGIVHWCALKVDSMIQLPFDEFLIDVKGRSKMMYGHAYQ